MKNSIRLLAILFLASFALVSCDKDDEATPTLYDRLGGVAAISAVVDQFLTNVVGDNVINARFAATVASPSRTQLLRNNLIDQICAGAGGPCQYKGKTMLESHKGMNITQAEFNALVGDLVAALDKFKVPQKEKDDLLAILGPMQTDIVGK
ncbi:group I truncated hemoglobin [Haliscomenobacter hydrossis]|uniref:Globin n=1 Tax=Haliscomenobacter hydrossis (strain ATCC 27775 / DSM 1100 / LMG 10767 / O) TaxID=760192 RepID=F4L646_HALH1|nr:group 1 truncated hemoglobin [Haliscomenobacter hydrossis]AEE54064.1 globin [Haliscomenobacter hydrossis DSM 1100]